MSRRDPFEAFEIHTVAEFSYYNGGTGCETVDTPGELESVKDEAINIFYTVYGWRRHPDDGFVDGSGLTAISDFDDLEAARDMAAALAAGRVEVHDFSV